MALPPPPPVAPLPAPTPPPASVSACMRARWLDDVAAPAETVMERVGVVEKLMREGLWHKSLATELADRWRVTVGAVQRYSAEAKRRLLPLAPPQARAHVEQLLEHAEELIPHATDPSGAAVKVALVWAKLYGLDRPAAPPKRADDDEEGLAGAQEETGDDWWDKGEKPGGEDT